MAAEMADLFSDQHILLSAVYSFYGMALKFSRLLQLEFFMKIYVNLAHLHIQNGRQDCQIMSETANAPQLILLQSNVSTNY